MYSYDDALRASQEYFSGDDLAARIFVDKYALRDNNGNILEDTPDKMHRRMAKEFARIESKKFKEPFTEDQIYSYFKNFKKIIPQGGPMFGIGNPYQYVTLSNCYVLDSPRDSYAGINYLDAQITQISSRRGGCGWSISKLRPKHTLVKNAAKTTSGAISFMHRFSNTIREVCQNGRRGASLQSCSVYHPDILDFITVKRDSDKVTGSNITVHFKDKFMQAVVDDTDFELMWPVCQEDADEMGLKFPTISKTVRAKDIWNEFIIGARDFAEPGACFIDQVHRESTGYHHGHKEISSNPCGEQYLPKNASCRLIVILLLTYVKNPFTKESYFDFIEFARDVAIMQRLADDMVDLDIECVDRIIDKIKSDPEPEYIKRNALDLWEDVKNTAIQDRRTGCGFTGLGDTLAALNIKYGSEKSIEFCEQMQKTFKFAAYEESVDMAKELGHFPCYTAENDIKSKFIQRLKDEFPSLYDKMKKFGRRNMVLLTVAPTGTVSCLTQTTSGIEPVFMLEYKRRKKGNHFDDNFRVDFTDQNGDVWQEFVVKHKGLQDFIDITGETDITKSPYWGATANEIDWLAKTRLQGVLQKHIDNSISVTTNLPNDVSYETVSQIYLESWKNGNKGCTVYRDGCRTGVLVANEANKPTENPIKRPKELPCDVYHISVKGQPYFVLVGLNNGLPYEVFAGKNGVVEKAVKTGKIIKRNRKQYKAVFEDESELTPINAFLSDEEEAITRCISALLRHGVDISIIVHQLEKINGDMYGFAKSILKALKKYIKDGTEVYGEECPNCKGKLTRQEGCVSCSCGWTKC